MLTILGWLTGAALSNNGGSTCPSVAVPEMIRWSEPGSVVVAGDAGETFVLKGYVRLGELSYRWSSERHVLPANGRLSVPLSVPVEAFLDDLAVDYVSDLLVQVDFGDRRQTAPAAFLLWSSSAAPPEVLLEGELDVRAPNGVTRAELREGLPEGARRMPAVGRTPVARIGPFERSADGSRVVPDRDGTVEDTGVSQ